jgi:hypothetical protein
LRNDCSSGDLGAHTGGTSGSGSGAGCWAFATAYPAARYPPPLTAAMKRARPSHPVSSSRCSTPSENDADRMPPPLKHTPRRSSPAAGGSAEGSASVAAGHLRSGRTANHSSARTEATTMAHLA